MAVLVVLRSAPEAAPLVRWGARFARARDLALVVVVPVASSAGEPRSEELALEPGPEEERPEPVVAAARAQLAELPAREAERTGEGEDADEPAPPRIVRSLARNATEGVLALVRGSGARLLLVAHHEKVDEREEGANLARQLFDRASCDVLLMRPGANEGSRCGRILVPTAGGRHAMVALQWAAEIAEQEDCELEALYVEPQVGEDAELVGQRILGRVVARVAGPGRERVRRRVVVARNLAQGIAQVTGEPIDLLVAGASDQWFLRKLLFRSLPEQALFEQGTALAVLRRSIPLGRRATRALRGVLESVVPQLEREDRVDLVERVQSSSRASFDFLLLVGASTLIACLGLEQDSAAVVIGAMLVAPLMTPLVGGGLALVQGNLALIRDAARSLALGFLLAYLLSVLAGSLTPNLVPTREMLARGSPSALDLGIAFFGGLAAAYAQARPNLSSALPGVAIAAALVPPIATAGLATALGQLGLAAGALLLFVTNILAIVLGSSVAVFAVGIRSAHRHGRKAVWSQRAVLALGLTTLLLGSGMLANLLHAPSLTRLERELAPLLAPHALRLLAPLEGEELAGALVLTLSVGGAALPDAALADQLARRASELVARPVRVRLRAALELESGPPAQ